MLKASELYPGIDPDVAYIIDRYYLSFVLEEYVEVLEDVSDAALLYIVANMNYEDARNAGLLSLPEHVSYLTFLRRTRKVLYKALRKLNAHGTEDLN